MKRVIVSRDVSGIMKSIDFIHASVFLFFVFNFKQRKLPFYLKLMA